MRRRTAPAPKEKQPSKHTASARAEKAAPHAPFLSRLCGCCGAGVRLALGALPGAGEAQAEGVEARLLLDYAVLH